MHCAPLCSGDTVRKHALVGTNPVFESNGGVGQMSFNIIKKVILIIGE
jgi:hypothetical protein